MTGIDKRKGVIFFFVWVVFTSFVFYLANSLPFLVCFRPFLIPITNTVPISTSMMLIEISVECAWDSIPGSQTGKRIICLFLIAISLNYEH